MTRIVAGIDLGSTGVKILLADADENCRTVLVEQRPTPWRSAAEGRTELDPDALLATLTELLAAAAAGLQAQPDLVEASVLVVAISGMGETGILLDAGNSPAAPGIAWFDPRGEKQLAELENTFGEEFPARTGLPLGVQVPVVKLASLADEGLDLAGLRWLNLPDWVAAQLGADIAADSSLTSRTGLLDADTGLPWPAVLDHLGVGPEFLPPVVDAGTPRGIAGADWIPPVFRGAQVTVAGHDHLVSAVAGGAVADGRYHASLGTAEVLLRVLDRPLPPEARVRLARYFINCVRHVVPGTHVLVAGVKTGLLQRRALQLAGISDRAGRDALDAAVLDLPVEGNLEPGAIEVRGARNDDGVLGITVHADGVTPAELFAAVLRHGNDELAILVDAIDRELPPARATVLTGGWAQMRSVRRARALVVPDPTVSEREEDTAHGAALFAARLTPPRTTTREGSNP